MSAPLPVKVGTDNKFTWSLASNVELARVTVLVRENLTPNYNTGKATKGVAGPAFKLGNLGNPYPSVSCVGNLIFHEHNDSSNDTTYTRNYCTGEKVFQNRGN